MGQGAVETVVDCLDGLRPVAFPWLKAHPSRSRLSESDAAPSCWRGRRPQSGNERENSANICRGTATFAILGRATVRMKLPR